MQMHFRLAVSLFLSFALFLCFFPAAAYSESSETELLFPEYVTLGPVTAGEKIERSIALRNTEDEPVYLNFTTTCPCLKVEPLELSISPSSSAELRVLFDSWGYSGKTIKKVYVASSIEKYHGSIITFEALVEGAASEDTGSGRCLECEEREQQAYLNHLLEQKETAVPHGEFFYSAGCRECDKFLENELPELLEKSEDRLVVIPLHVTDPEVFELFLQRTLHQGKKVENLPALILKGEISTGIKDIRAAIIEAVSGEPSGKESTQPAENTPVENTPAASGLVSGLAPIPIFGAGLIDGINPCAFTTIIFMLSALALYGRSRRQMLSTGLVFSGAVFVTYYLVGLGFFAVIRRASAYSYISDFLRWGLVFILILFALISIYDGIMIRKGKTEKVILQLSLGMKQRIHKSIRHGLKSASLIGGAALMGVFVSLFELACTGQVYLPTITYMVTRGFSYGYALLLIYNIGFILPLLAVFFLVYTGTSSKTISSVFSTHMATVKFSLSGIFLLLGFLTLLQ